MRIVNRKFLWLETCIASLIIAGINLLYPENPAFSSIFFMPYLLTAVFFSVFGGLLYGAISIGISTVLALGVVPYAVTLMHPELRYSALLRMLVPEIYIGMPLGIFLTYLFGMVRGRFLQENTRLRARFKRVVKQNHRYFIQTGALIETNEELEERLSRQQESIMALFNQVKKIDTVSIDAVLKVLLETVNIFIKTERASVWQYDAIKGRMALVSAWGWDAEDGAATTLPVDDTIEGWVVRNNQLFSVRMLLQFDNLERLYDERNILTLPIQIENKIWGVLNIEELPFVKYNLYTERLLFIIISLMEPSLQKAVEYESIMRREEVDALTGLPLFTSFYKVLNNELERKQLEQGKLSIIIVDLVNYSDLIEELDEENLRRDTVPLIIQAIHAATEHQGQAFQFKMSSQLGYIFPNLDYDGASLYCLQILERMNEFQIGSGDHPLPLEAVIGFSSFAGNETADELIDRAENLLEMQKL